MFFKVFLLMIFFANASSTYIAEQDYYKHYNSDEYDDYEYKDGVSEEQANKPTDKTTNTYKSTSNPDASKVTDEHTKRKQTKTLIKEFEKERTITPSENTKSTPSIDNYDDITYVLTDKPNSNLPEASYEVTENVDDIPNTVTFKPIHTNFTIKLPLNNATGVINTSNGDSGENKRGNNLRKNSISIFHVNAEFDDDKKYKPVIQNINIHKIPLGIFKVKDHVDKLKDDVLNYVHNTEVHEEADYGYYLPSFLAAPKNFLNMLREKGSRLFNKIF